MCTLQAYYTYMRDVAELLGAEPETASKEMLEVCKSGYSVSLFSEAILPHRCCGWR